MANKKTESEIGKFAIKPLEKSEARNRGTSLLTY